MAILALGISYRRAPIELLERMTFAEEDYAKAFRRVRDLEAVDEAAILSTCNRVEVYASVPSYHEGFMALKRFLSESRDVDPEDLGDPLYSHFEDDAAEHLFSVAAGLDSMVLGEPQIHAQVRDAYRRAEREGAAGSAVAALFHSAARAGRRARTETALGDSPAAFVEAGLALASGALGGLEERTAIVVGAGRMSSLAAKALRARGLARVRVLNRSADRARALAERTGADHDDLDAPPRALAGADVVVSATGAAGILIRTEDVRAAADGRRGPIFLIDLAVPRDVEPAVGGIPGVGLVDIAGLQHAVHERSAGLAEEIERARGIVSEEVRRFAVRRRSERLAPLIRALRERGEEVLAAELRRHRARLADLSPDELDAVEGLARGIVSKLLHDPIVRLKERGDGDLARALTELFDIG